MEFVEVEREEIQDIVAEKGKVSPFLKWAGGKYKIVDYIKKCFPKKASRYIEPFVGAGSVALNVDFEKIVINDINSDLIQVYIYLQEKKEKFIDDCRKMFIPENNTRERFSELKKEFNKTKDSYRKATIFIYLNRHCFNGLCRYNGSGEFNTPIGNYINPYFPEKQLYSALDQVSKFEIMNDDYKKVLAIAGKGDVVYCDPPYLPISESASFNAYAKDGFSLQDQIDLSRCASDASNRGATVLISNHYNWYSKQIYTKMFNGRLKTLEVSRTISSNIKKREPVKELIAIFSPKGTK